MENMLNKHLMLYQEFYFYYGGVHIVQDYQNIKYMIGGKEGWLDGRHGLITNSLECHAEEFRFNLAEEGKPMKIIKRGEAWSLE